MVWGGGPFEMASAWARGRDAAGDCVRSIVVDWARRKAERSIDRAVGVSVRAALAEESRLSRVPQFCASIDEAVLNDCERVRPLLRSRLAGLFWLPRRRARISFAASSIGFHSAVSLGALEFFHDVCGLTRHTAPLAGLWQIAKNAGWMIPHQRICWLSERPALIAHDPAGRLHAAKGPAIRYRDGWSAYAWKGVLVPAWLIERPEFVTVRTIAGAGDPQVRRCMIDILTPQRFIETGGAYRVSQDETGILWRQRWRWEAWAAVEVVNGTPEPDGSLKRYFLQVPANVRSAREGVAWTYGLTEHRYRPVART
jgi:hypothetical protein